MHIWVQKSASIQLQTSSLKLADFVAAAEEAQTEVQRWADLSAGDAPARTVVAASPGVILPGGRARSRTRDEAPAPRSALQRSALKVCLSEIAFLAIFIKTTIRGELHARNPVFSGRKVRARGAEDEG